MKPILTCPGCQTPGVGLLLWRMFVKSRLWLFAIVLGAAPTVFWVQGTPTLGQQPAPDGAEFIGKPTPVAAHLLKGSGSCAAAACHNNYHQPDTRREHILWIKRDPHSRAYEVLFDKVAVQMQKKLHRAHGAHEDQQCLRCHAAPEYVEKNPPAGAKHFKTDGVGCESCHGPASEWINHHHLDAWQALKPAQKKAFGMTDTQSLVGRAQVCARCHIGEPGMDVDHELIAAGHPRLNFEFAAFHAGMPQHWPASKDRADVKRGGPDLDARAWAIGQLVGAQAALELLAARADREKSNKPWPEFAEHDCMACHHDLRFPKLGKPSFRQEAGFGKRKPGVLPWGNYVTMTPVALASLQFDNDTQLKKQADEFEDALKKLQWTMDNSVTPNRDLVAKQAREAVKHLKPFLANLSDRLPATMATDKMLQQVLDFHGPKIGGSVDEVTQLQLSLAALLQTRHDLKMPLPADLRTAWDKLSPRLALPPNYQDAKIYDPKTVKDRILGLKNLSR